MSLRQAGDLRQGRFLGGYGVTLARVLAAGDIETKMAIS